MKLSDIPEEIITEYKLRDLVEPDDCGTSLSPLVCTDSHTRTHSQRTTREALNQHGYHQSKLVPGLWSHKWRPIWFTLVVDDFGVKYVGKEHALHLKSVLESYYPLSTDWTGNRYIGIRLDWDYNNRKVHLSMPGYKAKALKQFHHKPPSEPQHSPFPTKPIKYGAKKQYADRLPLHRCWTRRAKIHPTSLWETTLRTRRRLSLLCPISAIASQSAAPTQDTMTQTLNSSTTWPRKKKRFSPTMLAIWFLPHTIPPNNGAILNIAHIIKHAMAPATEAELAAVHTAREAVYIRIILMELGHKQPATPLQTDNAMAEAVTNGKVQPSAPRPWTCASTGCRSRMPKQFRIYWRPGHSNYADYWTKHHSAKHHQHTHSLHR
eukprot:CCRYP_014750-RA/>CCRYP_014750-RA protein AED:0.33 eAED:0.34 QI:0/-1/0/1/-1/1/1/0/377